MVNMKGKKNNDLEINQIKTTLPVFMEMYNSTIPANFTQASVATLKKFQSLYPSLFKNSEEWSIDKHRKKLIEWLPSSHNNL